MSTLVLAFTMAMRDLRHGLSGFRVFIACLALGVAAIAAVNLASEAFLRGLATKGQELLGGDVELRLTQREATDAERAWIAAHGRMSLAVELRGMVRTPSGEARTLVEIKAVDQAYPLFGAVEAAPQGDLQTLLAKKDGLFGVLADANLLPKLKAATGSRVVIGTETFQLRGVITAEPDRVAGGFSLGPRVMMSVEGLRASGLIQPGSLMSFNYRADLSLQGSAREETKAWIKSANDAFPEAGWQPRDRWNVAPGVRRFIDEVGTFLTLVGLTALIVGGVGAGNAVRSYLDRRRDDIATFKCLGATGGFIVWFFMIEVAAIALIGTVIGLALGVALPFALLHALSDTFPVPVDFAVSPMALIEAGVFGLIVALVFALWPLARAREISPASLFRDILTPQRRWPRLPYLIALALGISALVGLALTTAGNVLLAAGFLAAAGLTFGLLRLSSWIVMRTARASAKHTRSTDWRLALTNLFRPGAPTPAVMLSLGLGLTLISVIAAVDINLRQRITRDLPGLAPSFFFVDIQSNQTEAFDRLVKSFAGVSDFERTPMLRGRITKLKGIAAAEAKVEREVRWALNGDRGISYGDPKGAKEQVVEGQWWASDYRGPALVSFDQNLANGMHLKTGDTITVNVAGRDLELKIASLRKVDYANARMNFSLIVSPGVVDGAPHMHLATARAADTDEPAIEKAVAEAFPNVSIVRVKEAIATANSLLSQLADAVSMASGITLLTGILVLGGAVAAGQRQRVYDAVVLKVLGATRGRVLGIYILEFAMVGLAAGLVAAVAGTTAAWAIVTFVFQGTFTFPVLTLLAVVSAGILVTIVLGLWNTWGALSAAPARMLRAA